MPDHYFSPEARLDLLEVWEYIARDNISAADGVVLAIHEAAAMLASNPDLGHTRKDLTSKQMRFWPVHSYLIIYDPTVRPIEIVRILSGYRDLAVLLK
jgi:plasmid stabilization system protein ParE